VPQINPVLYADKKTHVEVGDAVVYRAMLTPWRRRNGRVSYVPGISKFNPEMEYNGLAWIGVAGDDGRFRGVLVDPESNCVKRSVQFVARSQDGNYVKPEDIPASQW
jgi:hypothetical protein